MGVSVALLVLAVLLAAANCVLTALLRRSAARIERGEVGRDARALAIAGFACGALGLVSLASFLSYDFGLRPFGVPVQGGGLVFSAFPAMLDAAFEGFFGPDFGKGPGDGWLFLFALPLVLLAAAAGIMVLFAGALCVAAIVIGAAIAAIAGAARVRGEYVKPPCRGSGTGPR